MANFGAAPHVARFYPGAIDARLFMRAFLWYARNVLRVTEERIAFLSSVCSDDLNSVELPHTAMVGPFIFGGLDGYPFAGKTGIGAFSHHIPKQGAALMFFGPHVGITDAGEVGKVVRPGQSAATPCCGAAMAGLQNLIAGRIRCKQPCDYDIDDYQQDTLEQLLLKHKKEILGPGTPDVSECFLRTTEVIYLELKSKFTNLLGSVKFEVPAFVFGGILINEDGGKGSSIELRHALRLEHGTMEDVTHSFIEATEAKFKELQSGNEHAFN